MIPDHIIEKALYPAAAAIFKVIPGDGARAAERAAVEALRAGLAAVYADIQAEALREAARVIDCRYASLMPGCDVDALDYDTPTDYGTDLAAWWLTDRAAKLDGSTK